MHPPGGSGISKSHRHMDMFVVLLSAPWLVRSRGKLPGRALCAVKERGESEPKREHALQLGFVVPIDLADLRIRLRREGNFRSKNSIVPY